MKKSEKVIGNPNSYQKQLDSVYSHGGMSKSEYYQELIRYDDFQTKQTISDDTTFNNLISDIEMKELIIYLGGIHLNE